MLSYWHHGFTAGARNPRRLGEWRERERERERETDRQTDRDRDRETERQRDRDRDRESGEEGRAILNHKTDTDHILARDRNLKRWGGERVFGTFFYHPFGTQVVLY